MKTVFNISTIDYKRGAGIKSYFVVPDVNQDDLTSADKMVIGIVARNMGLDKYITKIHLYSYQMT